MKIIFVDIIGNIYETMHNYSFGISSLAAVLKQNGHRVSYLPITSSGYSDNADAAEAQLRKRIESFTPDIIGISAMSDYFDISKVVVNYINRTFPELLIIAGGVHATSSPESFLKIKGIAGVCLGEGEYGLLELLNRMQNKEYYLNTQNFWFKDEEKVIRNPLRPLINNLDVLPFEDLDIFNGNRIIDPDKRFTNGILPELGALGQADIMASRNCPGNCHYCFNSRLRQLYKGRRWSCRRHSVAYAIEQIKAVTTKYGLQKIHFWDDSFADDIKWLKDFSRDYRKATHLPFRCLVRPDLTEEKVRLLKEGGCHAVNIGVECGNDYIRQKILNRPWSKGQILKSCRLLKKYKIITYVFSMVGCPCENESTLKETYHLIKKIRPDTALACSIFKPYPGTQSYLLCKKKRWLNKKRFGGYFTDSQLNLPGLSKEVIKKYQSKIMELSKDYFLFF